MRDSDSLGCDTIKRRIVQVQAKMVEIQPQRMLNDDLSLPDCQPSFASCVVFCARVTAGSTQKRRASKNKGIATCIGGVVRTILCQTGRNKY